MDILLDFDGTVAAHQYPKIGFPVPQAIRVIKRLVEAGHNIVLNTYRADCNDGTLGQAVRYMKYHDVDLHKVLEAKEHAPANECITQDSKYIDDQQYGTPLLLLNGYEVVDWLKIESACQKLGIL